MKRARIIAAGVVMIVLSTSGPGAATFPGRNGRVMFAGTEVDSAEGRCFGEQTEVFTMDGDGSDVRNLTQTPEEDEFYPVWSPNGERIALVSRSDNDGDEANKLQVMKGDASGRRTLASSDGHSHPSWSDHGFWIAYGSVSSSDFEQDIRRIRSDGSRSETVVGTKSAEYMPAYAPDGERIAYVSNKGRQGYDIWTVRSDGTKPRQLTHEVTAGGQGASHGGFSTLGWSPDGRWLIFTMNKGEGRSYIYRMRRNGRRMKRLAQGRDPVWSPNGRTIIFQGDAREGEVDCTLQLFRMDPDGSNERKLPKDNDLDMFSLDWQAR